MEEKINSSIQDFNLIPLVVLLHSVRFFPKNKRLVNSIICFCHLFYFYFYWFIFVIVLWGWRSLKIGILKQNSETASGSQTEHILCACPEIYSCC